MADFVFSFSFRACFSDRLHSGSFWYLFFPRGSLSQLFCIHIVLWFRLFTIVVDFHLVFHIYFVFLFFFVPYAALYEKFLAVKYSFFSGSIFFFVYDEHTFFWHFGSVFFLYFCVLVACWLFRFWFIAGGSHIGNIPFGSFIVFAFSINIKLFLWWYLKMTYSQFLSRLFSLLPFGLRVFVFHSICLFSSIFFFLNIVHQKYFVFFIILCMILFQLKP